MLTLSAVRRLAGPLGRDRDGTIEQERDEEGNLRHRRMHWGGSGLGERARRRSFTRKFMWLSKAPIMPSLWPLDSIEAWIFEERVNHAKDKEGANQRGLVRKLELAVPEPDPSEMLWPQL